MRVTSVALNQFTTAVNTNACNMVNRVFYRSDLVANFPVCFTSASLYRHFNAQYESVVGRRPDKVVIQSIVKTFLKLWRLLKKKESFLNLPKSRSWLETPLPICYEPVATQPLPHLQPQVSIPGIPPPTTQPSVFKPRKHFLSLSNSAKRKRVISLFTRIPDFDELSSVSGSFPKRSAFIKEEDKRKADNKALELFFNVNLGEARYRAVSKLYSWPSYYRIQRCPNISLLNL